MSSSCRFVSASCVVRLVFFSPSASEVVDWPAEETPLLAFSDAFSIMLANPFK
ncbi:hypothetical protein Tco_0538795, partial [Tanacetum coccineum]